MSRGPKDRLGCFSILFIICLILVGLFWLSIPSRQFKAPSADLLKGPATPQPAPKSALQTSTKPESKTSLPQTPAEYLKEAKRQLDMKTENYPNGDWYAAKSFLSCIPDNAPENIIKEKQALLLKIEKLREKDLAPMRKIKTAERLIYGPIIENIMLDKGYDVTIKVSGKNATILTIKWILVSRVTLHHLNKDGKLLETWRNMGFTKVIFTDGYHDKWIYNLKLPPK